MQLSNNRMSGETGVEAEAMNHGSSSEACLPFVNTGGRERERGNIGRRERICVAIDGGMGGGFRCSFIYSCLYR